MHLSHKFWAVGAMVFGVAALGAFGVSAWIASGGFQTEETTETIDNTAAKRYEDSIEVAKPIADPTKTPEPVAPPTTDSKQDEPYTITFSDSIYVLFGPSRILEEKGEGYFMRVVDSRSMLELETVLFELDDGYATESGSNNGWYDSDSAQVDDDGHVYFASSNEDVFHRSEDDTLWKISQALESGATKTLVEVTGNPIANWVVSPEGDYIVYDVVGDRTNYDHELYRYDLKKGTNTRIAMNTPYDQDYQPMDGAFRSSFIDLTANELYGAYTPKDSKDIGYFFRVNIKSGVFTQTATHNWNFNQDAYAPRGAKTAWWDGGLWAVKSLKVTDLDLTKGTSYGEKEALSAYSGNTLIEWSPTGNYFTFQRNNADGEGATYVYDLVTNKEKATNLVGKSVGVYEWLSDTEFLFHGDQTVGVYNVSTGENRLFGFKGFIPYGIAYFTKSE